MRAMIFVLFSIFSVGVFASPEKEATEQATKFYTSYLTSFASDSDAGYPPEQLKKYVAAETIKRIEEIQKIPEQEVLESDYFTYSQDYDPSWIPALRVDKAQPLHGEEVVQVWLGVENGKKLHLEAFMRLEDNNWKIYRVRDITNNYEHPIFKKP